VGGDWYDAFRVERPDTIGLVVGDVVGRGIEAAATMGQLRSAVRALASTGLGPAALLEALDRYAHRHSVGRMATLVYAELDLSSRDLRYACAGHLPPAVIGPGVAPSFAWDGRSLPLAAFPPIEPREEGALTLPPGGGVVLYTDGLVERPSQSLEKGMDGLLEMIARQADSGSPLADPIVRAFHDSEHSDDVCVLAVRLSG
jgi:serine/threonine-protein kinase RsbW